MEKIKSFIPKFTKNQLFEIDYKVLTLIGFTPDRMLNFRSFFIFSLCLLLEVFPEFYFIIAHSDDVQAVFMCLHEFFSLLVFVLKVFVFFFNRHNLVSLITDLNEEWKLCKIICNMWKAFFLSLHEAFVGANSYWKRTGEDLEKSIFKTTRNFYAFVFSSGFFYFTTPIIIYFAFFGGEEIPRWPLPVQV